MHACRVTGDATADRAATGAVHELLPVIFGAVQGQVVGAAAELGLGELLAGQERDLAELAALTGSEPAALARLLRALVRLGLLVETPERRFRATATGALLRRDTPYSMHHYALLNNREWLLRVLPTLTACVRTGGSRFADVHGVDCYGYLSAHDADAAIFHAALTELSRQDALALAGVFDFSAARTVVDLGGGEGLLLQTLLEAHPRLNGILVDLPPVAGPAQQRLKPLIDAGRCRVIGSDFTEQVPVGDLYVLKRIVSTTAPAVTERVLERIRAVIPAAGRLLIADPDLESTYGVLFDVLMLMATGGALRSESDMRALLAQRGFRLEHSHANAATLRVLEAVPA